jgi:hypothetical protein
LSDQKSDVRLRRRYGETFKKRCGIG